MRGMTWSWEDLIRTPAYVKRYCWDLLQMKYQHEHEQMRKNQPKSDG